MIRKRIFEIIEPADNHDKVSKVFDNSILIIIVISIISIIIESFDNIAENYTSYLYFIEVISIVIFSIEYLLRIFTSDILYNEKNKLKAVFNYITSPMAIVDLFAIIPFYLPMFISIDLRVLRILRLTRIFRIFKINRYTKSLKLISKVLKNKKEELVITLFVTLLMLILSSSIMYVLESDDQPENFPNIIASFWWAVATLTTVGYGDVYPVTFLGKLISGIIALLGIGLVALPTGIISSGFIEELEKKKENINTKKRSKKIQKGTRKLRKVRAMNNIEKYTKSL